MLYIRKDGSMTLAANTQAAKAAAAVEALRRAALTIDEAYEHLDTDQMEKVRAVASRLMLMLEDE